MIIGLNKFSGAVFGLLLLTAFALGGGLGAAAADGKVEYSALEENLSSVDEKVMGDLKENTSGLIEDVTVSIAHPVTESAEWTVLAGASFGRAHPGIARHLPLLNLIAWAACPLYGVWWAWRRINP